MTTEKMKELLFRHYSKLGTYQCPEVAIPREIDNHFHRQRVDWLLYEKKNHIFRGFELKLTKSDFYSSAAHTFVYDYNYYVMPKSLYSKVKDDIPDFVGVWTCIDGSNSLFCEKRPKKQKLKCSVEAMQFAMFQALSREVNKSLINKYAIKTTKKGRIKK